jgi:hypothetical protein
MDDETRTPDQIRADIVVARRRLAAGVEGLVAQVHPAALRREAVGAVRAKAQATISSVTGQVVDDAGVRWDRVGTAVLSVTALLVIWKVLRGLVHLVRR